MDILFLKAFDSLLFQLKYIFLFEKRRHDRVKMGRLKYTLATNKRKLKKKLFD